MDLSGFLRLFDLYDAVYVVDRDYLTNFVIYISEIHVLAARTLVFCGSNE